MKINILLLVLGTLFIGCSGSGTPDGSIGPSSTSRISSNSVQTAYHDNNDIQIEALKRFNTEGIAVDIVLSNDGNIAYIASGDGGLEVVDVTNPASPYLIYSYDLPEYVNYVEVVDDVVYVAYIPEGLQSYSRVSAFDVQNPLRPIYLGSAEGKSGVGHSTITAGEYLYEVDNEGLKIYQARTGAVASYYLHDSAYALALRNNYIFIANGREGLTILKTNTNAVVGHVH